MNDDLKTRLGGLFLLLMGAGFAFFFIWRPYQQALAGASSVSLSMKAIGISILLPIVGLVIALGGKTVNDYFKRVGNGGKGSPMFYVYMAIIIACTLGGYFYIESVFKGLGYGK
jgi:TRAP-type C4-dicarboxylate transport system permease small subunit